MAVLRRYRFCFAAICGLICCMIDFTAYACCNPPCGPCERCVNGVCVSNCSSGQTCCNGSCCSGSCCNNSCCPTGNWCCYDKTCYNPNTHHCCYNGDGKTCPNGKGCCSGGSYCCDINTEFCCAGNCCNQKMECCAGNCCDPCNCMDCNYTSKTCESKCDPCYCETCDGNGICITCNNDPNKTCCQGNCCSAELGCCDGEFVEPYCLTSEGCGCDPPDIFTTCSDKTEVQPAPGGPVYYAYKGTGRGCRVNDGNVPCRMWRNCTEAGFHFEEICYCLNPSVPECYCTAAPWPYCQDCIGEGEWEIEYARSIRCVMP